MRNIVILNFDDGNPTGVVRYIQMLQVGMNSKHEMRLHLISLNCTLSFFDIKVIDNRIVAHIPFFIDSDLLKNNLYLKNRYFEEIAKLLFSYFQEMDNLLWHVQDLFLIDLAKCLSRDLGGAIITHLHVIPWKLNLERHESFFNNLYKQHLAGNYKSLCNNKLEICAYDLSSHIICVSISAKEHLISAYNINSSKISVIYNGLSKRSVLNGFNIRQSNSLLFVGRLIKEKGLFFLLNALKKINKSDNYCTLNLVGHCPASTINRIQTEYKNIPINILGKISFDELQKLYSTCTIGIIPSLHEQCSYVAIEMSMFGMPMIVSDVDALSEMFEDEVNALKIPLIFDDDFGLELDEEKLASAIIRLIDDGALRQKLSINAMKNYQEKFTLERMIENTINVYEQFIEQNNA